MHLEMSRQASSMLTLTLPKVAFHVLFSRQDKVSCLNCSVWGRGDHLFSYLGNLLAIKVLSCLI